MICTFFRGFDRRYLATRDVAATRAKNTLDAEYNRK
jgi:hypothetical protein